METISEGSFSYWLQFFAVSALIVYTGINLSRYGDVIAEKTGIGRAWVGLVMLAGVTSLPELITGISAVAIVGAPDIAIGDIMGSCVYNLAIIALLDYMNGKESIFKGVGRTHLVSSAYGILLLVTALFSMLMASYIPVISVGVVIGLYGPVIAVMYVIGVRAVYFYEKRLVIEAAEEATKVFHYKGVTLKKALVLYSVNALVLVVSAARLPFIAEMIALTTGLGESFMGSVFVAMTTSLPEVVVSIGALRIGAQDMAVANMLGSNMFNIFILFIDDLFYTKGALLRDISIAHSVTAFIAILMTVVVLIGLVYRPPVTHTGKKAMSLSYYSMLLVSFWLLSIVSSFLMS